MMRDMMRDRQQSANEQQRGFTLIELMVSMAMGLVIIAGLTSMFISYNRTATTVASRTERMSDLYLASFLMQQSLRESLSAQSATTPVLTNLTARGVSKPANYPTSNATFATLPYWHAASKTLTYQDLEGNVGIFQYQRTSNDRVYWLRPLPVGASGASSFQELIRDLDTTNGVTVTSGSGNISISLAASYQNSSHQSATLSLSFKTWARN